MLGMNFWVGSPVPLAISASPFGAAGDSAWLPLVAPFGTGAREAGGVADIERETRQSQRVADVCLSHSNAKAPDPPLSNKPRTVMTSTLSPATMTPIEGESKKRVVGVDTHRTSSQRHSHQLGGF